MCNQPAPEQMAESTLLAQILEQRQLYPVFQPIIDLRNGSVLGYEALIRGPIESHLHHPYQLFSAAIRSNQLHRLELISRRRCIEEFAAAKTDCKLFVNVSASLLSSPEHQHGFTVELLSALGIPQHNIVIELSEQHPFDRQGLSYAAVDHYRQMGFKVAIDDLGSGYSGLKLWSEVQPEYVKIDMHFVRNIDQDSVKREFVRSICNIAHNLRCMVIAEGIETLEELLTLQEMGVAYGQGFLLGRPNYQLGTGINREVISRTVSRVDYGWRSENTETAFSLIQNVPTVSLNDHLGDINEMLLSKPQVQFVPVLESGQPVGILRRAELMEIFSAQYGRALYEHKPVSKLCRPDMLLVEKNTPLEQVSMLITTHENDEAMQQELIIVDEGRYLGVGSLRDLLKRITEMKIRNARYANPLTLLPGNVPIQREVDNLLINGEQFRVAYFDLNNFKPFNDYYGYSRGDQVLRELGAILADVASQEGSFVGHIGGDDFVMLFRGERWRERCSQIIKEFEQRVTALYDPEDISKGGIWSSDRQGERRFFPLLSLAVGVVHPDPARCASHQEVAELAAQAKKAAKQMDGLQVFESTQRAA